VKKSRLKQNPDHTFLCTHWVRWHKKWRDQRHFATKS